MKFITKALLGILFLMISLNSIAQHNSGFKPNEVYKSKHLIVTQITENAFLHVSFLQTKDFGNVACNGLLVRSGNEVVVFDTPTNDNSSEELIGWIEKKLHSKINAVIATHFHDDCLGGLRAFHSQKIPSYAYFKTVALAKENKFEVPTHSFKDSLITQVGKDFTVTKFFGEGHTRDNVVGYFPSENVMFGGCLIKELNATKGYLGDANVADWSNTVNKIKIHYPALNIVVPGHGIYGNKSLLDYTIKLFEVK